MLSQIRAICKKLEKKNLTVVSMEDGVVALPKAEDSTEGFRVRLGREGL